MNPESPALIEMQRFFEEQRAMDIERRRLLIAEVGLIERRWSIAAVCRTCAGCENCERLHRQQDDVRYTVKDGGRAIVRSTQN